MQGPHNTAFAGARRSAPCHARGARAAPGLQQAVRGGVVNLKLLTLC